MANTISRRFTNICVFCGSSSGKNREFEEAADQLGRVLAEKKIHLVYGGGNLGLMGRVSKAAYDGGSQVLGVIPKALSSYSFHDFIFFLSSINDTSLSSPVLTTLQKKKKPEKKIHLVYGGGNLGLMGRVSKAAYDGGSQVLGVIPKALSVGGITGNTIGEVQIVSDMHERKAEMFSHADAFIALPGGFGTLEELFEVTSWAQLKIHQKPIGLLNICGFYDGLLSFLDHAVENQFISPLARRIIVTASNVHQLIEQLETNIGLSWTGLHGRVNWAVFTIWAITLSRKFQIL
ncbi:hypothetical protein ACOSQ2_017688 [Xanthoceras sorbifolium]